MPTAPNIVFSASNTLLPMVEVSGLSVFKKYFFNLQNPEELEVLPAENPHSVGDRHVTDLCFVSMKCPHLHYTHDKNDLVCVLGCHKHAQTHVSVGWPLRKDKKLNISIHTGLSYYNVKYSFKWNVSLQRRKERLPGN